MEEYSRAAKLGVRSFLQALRNWKDNPYTIVVGRRLWGPWPLLSLVGLTLAALLVAPFFPSFERLGGFIPPLVFLTYIPDSVRDLLWSMPAVFGFVVAWRVRSFRRNDEELLADLADVDDPGSFIFEAGATPIAIAAFVLAAGLELVEPLTRLVRGLDAGWYGLGSHIEFATSSVVVVAISAGVLSINTTIGKGLGQLFGAGFTLFGIRLGIGFAIPWMVGWWTYLPIPYLNQLGGHSPTIVYTLFNLAVAAVAWIKLRDSTKEQPFWARDSGDEEEPKALPEPDLPPLPNVNNRTLEED